jgi:type II secretory pathway component PulJ
MTDSESGFTLLEILIATFVAAFVVLVINGTYFGALRLHNSTQARLDRGRVVDRALGLVERDLRGIMVPAAASATPPTGTFSGQFQDTPPDSITQEYSATRVSPDLYTTTGGIDGWNPFSEVQVVAYFLTPTTDGSNTKNLVRAVTRNLLPVVQPVTDEQTVLTGVTAAEFDYFDGTQWDTTWDSTATSSLPVAVRFSVALAQGANPQEQSSYSVVVPVLVAMKASQSQSQTGGGR